MSSSHLPSQYKERYRGRIQTYPGVLLCIFLFATSIAMITYGGLHIRDVRQASAFRYYRRQANRRRIEDNVTDDDVDIISNDGQIGNPKEYPDLKCELPNYLSKNGQLLAESRNKTQVVFKIKGVNWFGMETGVRVPFGLWENRDNGTSAYEIASFLSRNKFNSVRLPVCIATLLSNQAPERSLVNLATNRALNTTSYMSTLQSIIKVLAYRKISVLISLHTLTTRASGGAWYSEALGISENDYFEAVDILTSELCSPKYWNILGLDLKNEPHTSSWGGADPDWHVGATKIGNRMLKGCDSWLAFVEGVNTQHPITLDGVTKTYYDWWGGGLQNVKQLPVELYLPHKVVYAPHYYTPAVNPAWYFYKGGAVQPDNTIRGYTELDDVTLKSHIQKTMLDMFGYLVPRKKEAVLLGEFAGLYANDVHPGKTTKRVTDFTIQVMLEEGYNGGYMWSLNPESAYQYNPGDTAGTFTEGLLELDWLKPNIVFLKGMEVMDKMDNLIKLPCFLN